MVGKGKGWIQGKTSLEVLLTSLVHCASLRAPGMKSRLWGGKARPPQPGAGQEGGGAGGKCWGKEGGLEGGLE